MNSRVVLFLLIVLVFITSRIFSQPSKLQKDVLDSTIQFTRININNISTSFSNNGLSDYNFNGVKGFRYPKDFYSAGFWWSGLLIGGKVNGEIRVSGTSFKTSLVPTGDKKIYRVRRDYKTGNLSPEINDGEGTEIEIRKKYETDWHNWPANEGAPYDDKNKNGIYEPEIDIPGYPGVDQTIWFRAIDFDTTQSRSVFGSLPLGIEIQATYWAYNLSGPLGNTIFRKYKIINCSANHLNDLYFSITADPDIGDATDDYVGCDTSLSLAYSYNAFNYDAVYTNHPPVFGFLLIKGPIENNQDLKLTSFNFFINTDSVLGYPQIGSYENGALHFYNLFQGKTKDGNYYRIPHTIGGGETRYPLSGDPVKQQGWVDGIDFPPGNRSFGLSTGPIELMPGESTEIVFSQIAAGGYEGMSKNGAIDSIRSYSLTIKNFYKASLDSTTSIDHKTNNLPSEFSLFQNYPNPFNPTTTIQFALPESGKFNLKVYNILGQEVVTLIDGEMNSGIHKVNFDAGRLASGVYIYKLVGSNVNLSKKMILMK
ncbi:MAG: T9SS type A sorting domain-containing protein [Melioribacteraceae bacterium]|nr:T9SS type A sorting domain-containing protein [Melioribacteraceae bacterium]